ncbi:hypothetical protein ABN028_19775 [Actinopolymorpha sp. B17G11]|uniref:hypothetical protein n=1 Tax=Actinopolymorpha sp. B17G11 TaxID=3160861 RepID=UPI0032E42309
MTESTPNGGEALPRVMIEDLGVDAVWVDDDEIGPVLVLSPNQSYASAVDAARRFLPEVRTDRVRALVRAHLPDAPDVDLAADLEPVSEPPGQLPTRAWRRQAAVGAAAALLATIGLALGQIGAWQAANPMESPYLGDQFAAFARQGEMSCEPIGELRARCTDWEGAVMLSEAFIGSRWMSFTFTYGKEFVGVKVFRSASAARQWSSEPAHRELTPSAVVEGRFVLWGNDRSKLATYQMVLRSGSNRSMAPPPPSGRYASPAATWDLVALPTAIGGLMLGTLGVEADDDPSSASLPQRQGMSMILEDTEADPPPGEPKPPPDTSSEEPRPAPTPERSPSPSPTPDPDPTTEDLPVPDPRVPRLPDPAPTVEDGGGPIVVDITPLPDVTVKATVGPTLDSK